MKAFIIFILSLLLSLNAISQSGEWTFMKGDSMGSTVGNYGVKGIPAISNKPASTYEPAAWTDLQGNFWMYAGLSWNAHHNALWKFEPQTNLWTWMHGTPLHNQPPVFGTKGISSPLNTPGSIQYGNCTFTDTSGNLWMMFGYSFPGNYLNTLWKYEISTNEWTWMSGDTVPNNTGQFGIQGIPSTNNCPPGRYEATSCWVDNQNNFWMYGGVSPTVVLDDLWKYNPSTNEWTWMKGTIAGNTIPVHGSRGIPSLFNTPGSRFTHSHWKDANDHLWFFGGELHSSSDQMADLWKYDISTNEYTWMSGSDQVNAQGNHGAYCDADSNFYPMARAENKACWTDACGRFWMMGGREINFLNDMWYYDPASNKWSVTFGDAAIPDSGNYGTMGVPSPTNKPPSRNGSVSWQDLNGNFWLFGGYALRSPSVYVGDLWRYVPDTSCGACKLFYLSAQFTSDSLICPGACVTFTNLSANATTYQWYFSGGNPSSSTDANPVQVCYQTPGQFDVTLIAGNANDTDTLTLSNYIVVYNQPPPQNIIQSSDTLFALSGSASYQWYYNGNPISGATDYFYVAAQNGNYHVVATDVHGCEVEAAIFNVIANVLLSTLNEVQIFPNPADEIVSIRTKSALNGSAEIYLFNTAGICVLSSGLKDETIDVSALPSGLYLLEIKTDRKIFHARISVVHTQP